MPDPQAKKPFQSAPSISLPKGGGAIRGIGERFSANPVTGTGSLTVPIFTSPGRSGFTPELALFYDSGAGNGPFGFGWNLPLSSITRKTDKGLPRYRDAEESDVFTLSGSEDLVPLLLQDGEAWRRHADTRTVGGALYHVRRYRPRIEGLFARIERWVSAADPSETFWRAISRENLTTLYGRTAQSRISDPDDPSRVFRWLISETYDDKGNVIVYDYKPEDSAGVDLLSANEKNRTNLTRSTNRYLKRVRYSNRTPYYPILAENVPLVPLPGDWCFEAVFDYGEHDADQPTAGDSGVWPCRNDPFSSYRAGFEVRTYRLCHRVLMFHHFPGEEGVGSDCLVRSTDFTYSDDPIFSFLRAVTLAGYKRQQGGAYLKKAQPPLQFFYSEATIVDDILDIATESLQNLPYGLDGANYQWVDMDAEGLSGVLTEQAEGWFYKRNLSPTSDSGSFAPLELVADKPSLANMGSGHQQLLDLAGDGSLDLVELRGPVPGFYERTDEGQWGSFTPFTSLPVLDWDDPNLKFVDLTGDGHADVLVAEENIFTWYPSLAEEGFGPGEKLSQGFDEEKGPRLIFADGAEAIFLADMSGDGLTDLVRIRNGEVSYWPSLGYGHFGSKVTMVNAPWFDSPDLFDQKRIRLADIDGSGIADIIYLGRDGIHLYFNQSGNAWAEARTLTQFPRTDNVTAVAAVDLLGNGTICLVWSSPLAGDSGRPMRYIDLMGGQKPHLLIGTVNNLGAETRVQYAPSTRFYLADKLGGQPWITRLPFPVHVVERVETADLISRNRFVTRYAYHHGYFDGPEREFRGFGMVEQWDAEEFGTDAEKALHTPPVLTRTWFHTGADLESGYISLQFEKEYHRESDLDEQLAGLTDEQFGAMLLDDSVLPPGLSSEEAREARRALKGSILRMEVYADDGTAEQDRPYSASERNYTLKLVQPRGPNRHAVLFTSPRETIDFHYERKLFEVSGSKHADPRVTHGMTLATDDFGNVRRSVAIGYGRRHDDPDPFLNIEDRNKQKIPLITHTENQYTNAIVNEDAHRAPLQCRNSVYELVQLFPVANQPDVTNLFRFDEMEDGIESAGDGQHDLPYEDVKASGATSDHPYRRLIERTRTLYRRDDLTGLLQPGQLEPLALPGESYKLAFTPGLLSAVYQRTREGQPPENLLPAPSAVLAGQGSDQGGYVDLDGDGHWWIPAGRISYHPDPGASPSIEKDEARAHFFLPRRFRDLFDHSTTVDYGHDLLPTQTTDALGNTVASVNDYRVLQPRLVTDPNHNRSEAAFDAIGMVVGTAVMGKAVENLGDSLAGFETDLEQAQIDALMSDPAGPTSVSLLAGATTRIVYDLNRFGTSGLPALAAALARETHLASLSPGEQSRIHVKISYSDGFGREIQKKTQAEPGSLADGGPVVSPRWMGTGWTIFNNKGKPVRQYEPFFDDTHEFTFDKQAGVSPVLFYDPVERVVATLHPNHSYEKVVFDPWRQETWDLNDTVLLDPKNDPDAAAFFNRLPETEYLPTWHAQRAGGLFGDTPQQAAKEQEAALKAALHAGTPAIAHFDALGRVFLTINHNKLVLDEGNGPATVEERYATRVELDIEGNQREVKDAAERVVVRYDYDMLGNRIRQSSMEAGERWLLNDAAGKLIRAWDRRGHGFRTEYDGLRRPVRAFVSGADPATPGQDTLFERTEYGEGQANDIALNLRTRIFRQFDGAGVATNMGHNPATAQSEAYDFKGNLLRANRQLAADYKVTPDWTGSPALEPEIFSSATAYDALNRPAALTTPEGSVIRPAYNEAGLLERLEANLRGSTAVTPFVDDIAYNAKGQRQLIQYANGIRTSFAYDPTTFRLTHLRTARGVELLQDLSYTYDPAGNITSIRDDAQQTVFFQNIVVEPGSDYVYDAVYRLIEATGREHLGQAGGVASSPTPPDHSGAFHDNLFHPGDGGAMGRYTETYLYDKVGNFKTIRHRATDPATGNWTRAYFYDESSLLEPGKMTNRLSVTTIGATTEAYSYDDHGNTTAMPHLTQTDWNTDDHLKRVVLGGGGEAYYVYDAAGQRVRKVWEKSPGMIEERIYLSGFEIFRRKVAGSITLTRETLHIMDDKQRVALVETRTAGNDGSPAQLIRYQFGNHLGSASLELGEQGEVLSYEEYYPYASTAYRAVTAGLESNPKRYRYAGKERDEESGFYYHGARYAAPWLGRWINPDPAGLADGPNLYAYVKGNPVILIDTHGRETEKVPIYYAVAIPAALRAAKDSGLPLKNAMLLLIWARGEQAPTKKDGTPYNPEFHSGRLLNAQPTKGEIKSICPNYAQDQCNVAKADGDFKGAYIYNLHQLLTPDTKDKAGERGNSAHFGFGDTYSMFVFTLRRIRGQRLKSDIPVPNYSAIDKKLRDPKTTPRDFFTSSLDIWAFKGYGAHFVTPSKPGETPLADKVPREVLDAVPKLIKQNEEIISREQSAIKARESRINELNAQNRLIIEQDMAGDAPAELVAANRALIQQYRGEIAEARKIVSAKERENELMKEFQKEFATPKK